MLRKRELLNRQYGSVVLVQQTYREYYIGSEWKGYKNSTTTNGIDAIVEHPVVDNPDFGDLASLMINKLREGPLNKFQMLRDFFQTIKTES